MGVDSRWLGAGLIAALAGVLVLLGGLSVAERHDQNCALCHLPPEATFVARAAGGPVDMAASHARSTAGHVACVDCHGGPGLTGRARSLRLGGRDLWHWLRGDYTVLGNQYLPADTLRYPVPDATCRACHAATFGDTGFENHYHHLLDDPRRPVEVDCVGCHVAHVPATPPTAGGISASVARQCEACHTVMGGPVGLARSPTPSPAARR